MTSWNIDLPWPPQNNHLYTVARGRKVKSSKGRKYSELVSQLVGEMDARYGITGSVKVKIIAHPPTRARRDLDNLFKAPLDALVAAGVIVDDSMIDDLRMVRGEVVKGGLLKVKIEVSDD